MVVFFDIDGTIVDDATQIIPASAVRAVERLRQAGHLPVVNTGRPFHHIDPRVRAMDFRAWICGCGMQVILDGEYLYRDYPSVEACHRATAMAKKCGLYQMCESERELFWNTELTHDQAPFQVDEAARLVAKGIPSRAGTGGRLPEIHHQRRPQPGPSGHDGGGGRGLRRDRPGR